MSKFVVLSINQGNFEQGFSVNLGIGEDGRIHHTNQVLLPGAPDIPRLYQEWQDSYRELGEFIRNRKDRTINVEEVQRTHFSAIDDENNARYRFERYLRQWFTQLGWEKLQVRIEARTQPDESIRVIIDTQNIYLKKLPWHLWQLFGNRPQAEFALGGEYAPPNEPLKRQVKILAIFGGSEGLDLTSDRELMTQLESRGAKITCLEKPERKELSQSLWKQHWDILFFAGHSSSGEECKTGQVQINDSQSISLSKLRHSLNTAVKNGLKLAIFNSCDGLGLADELIGIKVPQMIVMREPVPDEVARHFLEYFLEDFSKGHSLYLSVRNARQCLEEMEDDFPCASWLPVICQNPAARPLVWPTKSSFEFNLVGYLGKISPVAKGFLGAFLCVSIISILDQIINPPPKPEPTPPPPEKITPQNLGSRFSWGEKILIPTNSNQLKQKGVGAFALKDYEQSIDYFHQSLKQRRNDPETLIYLNNAVAMQPLQSDKLPVTNKSNPTKCFIPSTKPLKIAVVAPGIVGTQTYINQDILRGVAQAQNQINSNCGIAGRLLQVVIADDNDLPNISVNVATKLSKQKDILAVIGHYSSSATLEVGEIYEQKKMVAISPGSTAVRRSPGKEDGINLSKYVFRTPSNDGIAIKKLVNYMVNTLGHRKAAIAYDSTGVYSKKFREDFKKELELPQISGKFIDIPECDLFNNFNIENCLEKANQTVKVLALVPETATTFNKALEIIDSKKYSNLTLLGGDSLHNKTIEDRGEKAKNLVFAIPWFGNETEPSPFEKNARELWNTQNNQMSWRSAMSYDATMAIIEGLRRMGNNPTRPKLQQVLSLRDFSAEGAAGKIQFENGDRKITRDNDAKLNVLVQVKCNAQMSQDCKFNQVSQQ